MLRSLSAKQFKEWQLYEEIEPFGEARLFAHLATVIAGSAGARTKEGHTYTPEMFVRTVQIEPPIETSREAAKAKSPEYMEALINLWCDSSNQERIERRS